MRVGEFRDALRELADASRNRALKRAVNLIFTQIDCPGDMAIADFLKVFRTQNTAPPPEIARPPEQSPTELLRELRSSIPDDHKFDQALEKVRASKAVTKAALIEWSEQQFGRAIPSRTSRPAILDLISDERVIAVRNEKMGKMLGRRSVAAE